MEVRYKREVNHNYMILDAPSEGGGYECRMLASNTIEGPVSYTHLLLIYCASCFLSFKILDIEL